MKLAVGLLAISAFIAVGAESVSAAQTSQAQLQKQAKITEQQAQKTALAEVSHGVIKSSELEKEHGKLVWSFDVTAPNSTQTSIVQVDAMTGKFLSKKSESLSNKMAETKTRK
ncbi:MAG TPA: PepSY domain-containing protein [Chthoniobacterales bacterium]|jgi:uncharacterized membrane protein YkoI|nr:PepSY domain-containing protein [Chthoniobacterales bacterium]